MRIRSLCLSAALLLAPTLFARDKTDEVTMINGDHFTCEIKGLDADVLYVSLDYMLGTLSVQWSKVARVESKQLFIVKTADGSVYQGTIRTAEVPTDRPVQIQVLEAPVKPEKAHTIDQSQIVKMTETTEGFWKKFNGAVNTGVIYSKGNSTTQYNIGTEIEYLRERSSYQASYSGTLSASSGATTSTRNDLGLSGSHLLRWNNYFYAGFGDFLQSTELGIKVQTSLGGGIGRYLKNTNRVSFSVLGGFVWQNTEYSPTSNVAIGTQNLAAAAFNTTLKVYKFDKTNLDLTASFYPALSEPGRVKFNSNATYYIKITGNLSWNISVYANYDSRPPGNLPTSDYGSSSGLSWTFGLR